MRKQNDYKYLKNIDDKERNTIKFSKEEYKNWNIKMILLMKIILNT